MHCVCDTDRASRSGVHPDALRGGQSSDAGGVRSALAPAELQALRRSTGSVAMTNLPYIPETAPFTPEQRAWLNGFLAGLFANGVPGQLPGPQANGVPAAS